MTTYKIVKTSLIELADKTTIKTEEKTEDSSYNGLDYKTEQTVKYLAELTGKPVKVISTETLVIEPEKKEE